MPPPLVKEGWGGFVSLGRGSNGTHALMLEGQRLNPIESGKRFEPIEAAVLLTSVAS